VVPSLPTTTLPSPLPPTRTYSRGRLDADFAHSAERNKKQGGEEGKDIHDSLCVELFVMIFPVVDIIKIQEH